MGEERETGLNTLWHSTAQTPYLNMPETPRHDGDLGEAKRCQERLKGGVALADLGVSLAHARVNLRENLLVEALLLHVPRKAAANANEEHRQNVGLVVDAVIHSLLLLVLVHLLDVADVKLVPLLGAGGKRDLEPRHDQANQGHHERELGHGLVKGNVRHLRHL